MKNERISELFSANIDRLYAAAKEKHGERAEEALVNAVRKTAGKFKKLGEKAYITALLQELGGGAFYEAEEPAPYGLAEKLESIFTESYAAAQKKSRLFAILGGAAAAVCLAAVVGLLLRPGETIVTAGATIKGAKEFTSGDFVLTNVHTVNDYIGFDGDFRLNVYKAREQAASTVATDGTVYLLTVCATDTEAGLDTFGLFRMTGESWEEVCQLQQSFEYDVNPLNQEGFKYPARSFVFCDTESRPIVFLYDALAGIFTAYLCDVRTGTAQNVAEIPVQIGMIDNVYNNITACIDGEHVYFVSGNGGSACDILIFDLKSHEFLQSGMFLTNSSRLIPNAIVHRGDRTYLLGLDAPFNSPVSVYLYAIQDVAEDTQELIFERLLYTGDYTAIRRKTDLASLLVDEDEKSYVFFSFQEDLQNPATRKHVLEIVSAEGESMISKQYSPLIKGEGRCIFMGPEGTLYFIEEANQQIAVGVIIDSNYGEIRKNATFQGILHSDLLQPQYISDSTGQDELFLDLIGTSNNSSTVRQYGYMRLQLK